MKKIIQLAVSSALLSSGLLISTPAISSATVLPSSGVITIPYSGAPDTSYISPYGTCVFQITAVGGAGGSGSYNGGVGGDGGLGGYVSAQFSLAANSTFSINVGGGGTQGQYGSVGAGGYNGGANGGTTSFVSTTGGGGGGSTTISINGALALVAGGGGGGGSAWDNDQGIVSKGGSGGASVNSLLGQNGITSSPVTGVSQGLNGGFGGTASAPGAGGAGVTQHFGSLNNTNSTGANGVATSGGAGGSGDTAAGGGGGGGYFGGGGGGVVGSNSNYLYAGGAGGGGGSSYISASGTAQSVSAPSQVPSANGSVSITVISCWLPTVYSKPTAPSSVSASMSSGTATVSFSPGSSGNLPTYNQIDMLINGQPFGNVCNVVGASSCPISNLGPDAVFTFTVTAINSKGSAVSAVSNAVSYASPSVALPTTTSTTTTTLPPVKLTITCVKGVTSKKVTAVSPVCPAGFKKK
jgi:hypothetical protein